MTDTTDIWQPKSIIPPENWLDFCEWARDGGYDQSYFNRWDSKSLALQQQYLDELLMQQEEPDDE